MVIKLWVYPRLISYGAKRITILDNNTKVLKRAASLALIIYQAILYPFVQKAFGMIGMARISGVLAIPLTQSFPFIAMCSGSALFTLLSIASALKNLLSTNITTGLFLIQNRAVAQHQRGEANGIAMTFMSVFKTIGPAIGGAILSWSQTRMDASFLPGTHMVFFLINIVSAIGTVMFISFIRGKNKTCSNEQN